ncbi:hypothetical protein [Paenibacillus bovis]|nr:hypothetical protein [Paenibacillus bovis]
MSKFMSKSPLDKQGVRYRADVIPAGKPVKKEIKIASSIGMPLNGTISGL